MRSPALLPHCPHCTPHHESSRASVCLHCCLVVCVRSAWAAALALEMRAKYSCRYRLLHALSAPTAASFADRSIDVLFVDGLHTEAGVTADLHAWWPKLAGDAIVLFNDYDLTPGARHPGVARAVHAMMEARGFPRDALFVGSKGRAPGEGNAALCLPQRCKGHPLMNVKG